jgi:hypothetical protein
MLIIEQIPHIIDPISINETDNHLDILREGKPWNGVLTVLRKDGTSFPAHITAFPILDSTNKILIGIIATGSLIKSNHQDLENAPLEKPKAESLTLKNLRNNPSGYIFLDSNFNIITCDDYLLEAYGHELIGVSIFSIYENPNSQDMMRLTDVHEKELTELEDFKTNLNARKVGKFLLATTCPLRSSKMLITVDIKFLKERPDEILLLVAACTSEQKLYLALEKANNETLANHYKTRFFTFMSHELRTPLNGLFAETEMLMDRFSDIKEESVTFSSETIDQIKESLLIVMGCCQLQLNLINNLLDLRRILLYLSCVS